MFDFIDFHEKALKKTEENRLREDEERELQFKKKVFGGITSKIQKISQGENLKKTQFEKFEDIDFENLSISQIVKMPSNLAMENQEKNRIQKPSIPVEPAL